MRDSGQPMALSIALAPSDQTPDLIALAEELGIHRAWVYDSPAIFADIWMTLGLAAARTSRIGLGSLIIFALMNLIGYAGEKTGVPYPVLARASFGVWGANLAAMVRAVVACFWVACLAWRPH